MIVKDVKPVISKRKQDRKAIEKLDKVVVKV
jgi:hypothetical protein